jgi:hypothetical protein
MLGRVLLLDSESSRLLGRVLFFDSESPVVQVAWASIL